MQTIKTKYLSATNFLPDRIKATTTSGISITRSVHCPSFRKRLHLTEEQAENCTMSHDEWMHSRIALALMIKMRWKGSLVGGANDSKGGMVWVFTNNNRAVVERWY